MKVSLFVDKNVPRLICEKLGVDSCSLEKISDPGSSKSRVYLYSLGSKLVAAKVTPINNDYRDPRLEPRNRLAIAPLLGDKTAEIYWHGTVGSYYVMLYECVGVNSLHNAIQASTEDTMDLFNVWKESLQMLASMWQQTRKKVTKTTQFARNYDARFARIVTGLKAHAIASNQSTLLGVYLDYKVDVNGDMYPSFSRMLEKLERQDMPTHTVVCHGDPQPSNIIIDKQKTTWQFIDWEWSQSGHDWRMMAAHMYGWWLTRYVSFEKHPKILLDHTLKTIFITYAVKSDKKRELFLSGTMATLRNEAGLLEGSSDYMAFQKYLSLLALGEVRFLPIWKTTENAPYLLGLAVQLAHASIKGVDRA